ncbi:MAG TPA: ABC transporter substrate-binding protein [Aggregatilineales bacterium]|nr:ABC transporter substrate-binding protein [Anaerolineales bacterium]HRE49704.1 ABC transporter substrate-binding protein [Aggregatilineales bacterium]
MKKSLQQIASVLIIVLALTVSAVGITRAEPAPQGGAPLVIGVIGTADSSLALGVSLAVETANATGKVRFAVAAGAATTPDEVRQVVDAFKNIGVVAIFGPDNSALAAAASDALNSAGVPVFTGATGVDSPRGGLIFHTRAEDTLKLRALVEVLVRDRAQTRIAVYQESAAQAPLVQIVTDALASFGVPALLLNGEGADGTLLSPTDAAAQLLGSGAGAVVSLANSQTSALVFRALRDAGFGGVFALANGDDNAFLEGIPFGGRRGILTAIDWTPILDTPTSASFLKTYVTLFGKLPDGRAAAAFDGATLLANAVLEGATTAADIRAKLITVGTVSGVQGGLIPAREGGRINENVIVGEANVYGALRPVAIFDGRTRVDFSGQATAVPTTPPTAVPTVATETPTPTFTLTFTPSPTFTPTPTLPPTFTLVPSPTLDGVFATVRSSTLNVRQGPGQNYPILGQLNRNEQVQLLGANADFSWFAILFRQQPAWISGASQFISIAGDVRTLPLIAPPPTPTVPPTVTPTPKADIVMVNAFLTPAVPLPGQPFTLTVTLANQGGINAGQFAVAASMRPGEVFGSAIVPGLAAGQQTQAIINYTLGGTGVETIAIVLDLNREVDEGDLGEQNNSPSFTYKIDRGFNVTQATAQLAPGSSIDLFGGTQDLTFDPTSNLVPINGSVVGALSGVQVAQVHYDYLSPAVVNNVVGIAQGNLLQGLVIGVYTAEGQRAYIRVAGYNGANILLDIWVYTP